MFQMFNFIPKALGQLMYFIYNTLTFHNYGLAIIIFTIVIRIVILPLTIKQYRSSAKMQELSPQIQELQKRYKNDKEKQQQEMMKFYQENKVNPAGGCLPLLIQMPILFSLWYVITKPFTYMLPMIYGGKDVADTVVNGLINIFKLNKNYYPEINIIKQFSMEKAGDFLSAYPGLSEKILDLKKGFQFGPINLGDIPTYHFDKLISDWHYIVLLLLPLLAVATTYLSTILSMPKADPNSPGSSMTKSMMYIAPVMTLIFSFQFPAGLSLYWTVGYVIQIFQQMYINKHVIKKKEVVKK